MVPPNMSSSYPWRAYERLGKMHFCNWHSLWGIPPPHLPSNLVQHHIRSYLFFMNFCRLLGSNLLFPRAPNYLVLTVHTRICQGVTLTSMVSRIHYLLLWQGSQYLFFLNHLVFFFLLPQFLPDNCFGSEIIAFHAKDSSSLPSSCDTEDISMRDQCHARTRAEDPAPPRL